ncbi:hypothetical protein HQ520_14050 [bacterium]|nr:hypothetical protein [bacterium]
MKRCLIQTLAMCVFASLFPIASSAQEGAPMTPQALLIETEDFQFTGSWLFESEVNVGQFVRGHFQMNENTTPTLEDAMTAVELPASGMWHLWARSKDLPGGSGFGTRRFRLLVDERLSEKEGGTHGVNGWAWDRLGSMDLTAGEHMLALRIATHFARVDCVLLTSDPALDPNKTPMGKLQQSKVLPKPVAVEVEEAFLRPEVSLTPGPHISAKLANDKVRIDFAALSEKSGKKQIVKSLAVNQDGRWVSAMTETDHRSEALFSIYAPETELSFSFNPIWGKSPQSFTVEVGGKSYEVKPATNPFYAGEATGWVPRDARQVNAGTVEVTYESKDGKTAKGTWTLEAGRADVGFSFEMPIDRDGCYMVGMSAFKSVAPQDVHFLLLPPWYQYRFVPGSPILMLNTSQSHPLALVEPKPATPDAAPVTLAVVGDPAEMPFEWPNAYNATCGFSVVNVQGERQPTIFAPVLGLENSKKKTGETLEVSWKLLSWPGHWQEALEYVSGDIMNVTDYRKPVNVSLTDAALNMFDLMADDFHSGWDKNLKGFLDIESPVPLGKHAAPLMVISAALLTRDEKFFMERSLPTVEFLLTRRSCQLHRQKQGGEIVATPYMFGAPDFYGTSVWLGVHELLGGLNPWLDEFILPGGKISHRTVYNTAPAWSELLAQYRYQPSPALFDEIVRQADEFLEKEVFVEDRVPTSGFANKDYYPYWWDLTDLYDLTGHERYLKGAEEGAFQTISALWSQPPLPKNPNEPTLIHKGGSERTYYIEDWKSDERHYRLGLPRQEGDTPEKMVEAWKVSPVGMGIEGVTTYFYTPEYFGNVPISSWAPHLLRLYQRTGRDIYKTYARNGVIGRFANYPGYYLCGFTDMVHDPEYPLKGPDITTIYHHHIPPHTAFTVDYLFAQADQRSGGKVRFAHARQKDFVWFSNRIYGLMPGEVYGETGAVPWLKRGLVDPGTKDVDWIAARSKDRFFAVLMSQSEKPLRVSIKLDAQAIGLKKDEPYRIYVNDSPEAKTSSEATVEIPPMGIVTLSMPADEREIMPEVPVLREGHFKQTLANPWGDLHAFRIRTPFAKDNFNVFVNAKTAKGSLKLTLKQGDEERTIVDETYPFEISVYPLPVDQALKAKVELTDESGTVTTVEFEMGK